MFNNEDIKYRINNYLSRMLIITINTLETLSKGQLVNSNVEKASTDKLRRWANVLSMVGLVTDAFLIFALIIYFIAVSNIEDLPAPKERTSGGTEVQSIGEAILFFGFIVGMAYGGIQLPI